MFLSVSSVRVSRLRAGLGVECLLGDRTGDDGLEVAISYVGRSSEMGVRAGVRTAVLYEGIRASASISYVSILDG